MSQYAASVTVRLRESELADVDRLAGERGWSRSDVLRAAVATPQGISDPVEAIAGLVRRMHTAEVEREVLRLQVEQARDLGEQRVRDLQAEFARREAGLVNALWRALGQEPGTDRQLLDAVASLAAAARTSAARQGPPLPLGTGEGDEEVWIPPRSDAMEYRSDAPCPHCGGEPYHHRTGRCGDCGRRRPAPPPETRAERQHRLSRMAIEKEGRP